MNRRFSAVAIAAALISTCLLSEANAVRKRWDVGIHAGPSIAGIYGVDADSLGSGNRTGIAAGIYGTKWLNENVGIRLEALYSQKGAERTLLGRTDVTASLDYVDIPLTVLFSREIGEGKLYGHFYVGPAVSIRVSADLEAPADSSQSLEEVTKSYDFSGAMGLAFALRVAERLDLSLDLRYTVGFVSVDDTGNDLDYRNNTFSLLLGVETRLGYW